MEDMIYFYKLPLQIKEKPGAKKLKINK